MKIVKQIIFWIFYLAVLLGLIYGIPKGLAYVLKTDHPMASITSGSMWPSLKRGDLILIKGVEGRDEVKVGDIVVYTNPKGFTIHRIVEINGNSLVTKGDANNVKDTPITFDEIIGKPLYLGEKPLRIPLLGLASVYFNKSEI